MKKNILLLVFIFWVLLIANLSAERIKGKVLSIEKNKIKIFNLKTKDIEEIVVNDPSLFKKNQIIEYDRKKNKLYIHEAKPETKPQIPPDIKSEIKPELPQEIAPEIRENHFIRRRIRELYRRRNFNNGFRHQFQRGRRR